MMNQSNHMYLIGFMGTGKSTIALELGRILGIKRLEMDAEIEKRQGMAISQIFERYGEPFFRNLETKLIEEIGRDGRCIVSCGGGAVLRPENVSCMKKSGTIILLTAEPETVYERVKDSCQRPILNQDMSVEHIAALMEKRRPVYEAAADLRVRTDGKPVEEICREILDWLGI